MSYVQKNRKRIPRTLRTTFEGHIQTRTPSKLRSVTEKILALVIWLATLLTIWTVFSACAARSPSLLPEDRILDPVQLNCSCDELGADVDKFKLIGKRLLVRYQTRINECRAAGLIDLE